ncbi:MAG TPA: beta-ketoacyl synthase N-terminal-like domain-containing protein [Pelovirga sp.]|nr:beta-ketoacyl synthase N-terminal-like domain-containing protein [Pelovirga sp.]
MRLAIQGIGITGSFGAGVDALRTALQSRTVAPQQLSVDHHDGVSDSFPAYRATTTGLERFLPKRELRRIDHFSKMTLYAAHLALEDAELLEADRSRTGVVVASGYGPLKTTFNFLDSYLDFGYSCSSPTHFSNSVHNAAAAHVSMQLKLTSPSLTVTQFEMSVASALLSARQWLEEGRVDRVLFGATDEYCEVLRYCRRHFFADGEQGPLRPLDLDAQTAMVGEGAVFMVLERADNRAAYAAIDSVILGNHAVVPLELPPAAVVVAGADGHRQCGRWYAEIIGDQPVVACSPYYGSFPAAAGFDLAAAALMMRDQQLYAGPQDAAANLHESAFLPADEDTKLAGLKCGPGGDYGLICLSR